MAAIIQDTRQTPSQAQLQLLRTHLPYSLPVLRRLQVAAGVFDGVSPGRVAGAGTTPYAHILFAYDEAGPTPAFAAAYVDLSKAPETAAWVYASDQDVSDNDTAQHGVQLFPSDPPPDTLWPVDRGAELVAPWSPDRRARCRRLVLALLRRIHSLAQAEAAEIVPLLRERVPSSSPAVAAKATLAADHFLDQLKVNVHDGVRHLLQHPEAIGDDVLEAGLRPVTDVYWDAYDKWLFRRADVPVLSDLSDLSDTHTLRWDTVHTPKDLALVVGRTNVPRIDTTLLSVPSVALRDVATGVLQAWAFLGVDGSLWTLHTEPEWRGRGLAKTLASRLFRQYCGVFAMAFDAEPGQTDTADTTDTPDTADTPDDWIMADVSADNRQSQGVCRRLGGRRAWSSCWYMINYDSLSERSS